MGEIQLARGAHDDARVHLQLAVTRLESIGDQEELQKAKDALAKLDEAVKPGQ
jgi:hypothetical protein